MRLLIVPIVLVCLLVLMFSGVSLADPVTGIFLPGICEQAGNVWYNGKCWKPTELPVPSPHPVPEKIYSFIIEGNKARVVEMQKEGECYRSGTVLWQSE